MTPSQTVRKSGTLANPSEERSALSKSGLGRGGERPGDALESRTGGGEEGHRTSLCGLQHGLQAPQEGRGLDGQHQAAAAGHYGCGGCRVALQFLFPFVFVFSCVCQATCCSLQRTPKLKSLQGTKGGGAVGGPHMHTLFRRQCRYWMAFVQQLHGLINLIIWLLVWRRAAGKIGDIVRPYRCQCPTVYLSIPPPPSPSELLCQNHCELIYVN